MLDGSPSLGDVIRRFGNDLLRERGEKLTSAQRAVLSTLERCHTAALGGHLYVCDNCGAEKPAYNSCGNRHCPSCLGHKSAEWLAERESELLPVPYFHVVFTVPQEIAELALGNKKEVYTILFRAVSETLLEIGADPEHLGARIGFLAILHTWTQTLLHHPHIHCIVPGGGLSADGARWVSTSPRFLFPIEVLRLVFRGKFLDYLAQAVKSGKLRFAGKTAELADTSRFADFLQEQRRKDWVVYAKAPFGSPEQVLKYLARYTHRVAISDRRIVRIDESNVTFRYRDRAQGNCEREMTLSGVEFLRRFLLHVLPQGFMRIRYYGLFANRCRKDNLARCRERLAAKPALTVEPTPPPAAEPEATNEHAPHLCPECGVGQMVRTRVLEPVPDVGADTRPTVQRDTS